MKKLLLLFALAPVALWAAPAFIHETDSEFIANPDLNGDGRPDQVLVDKQTGGYRIGMVEASGTCLWLAPRGSGISDLTGFAVGKLITADKDAMVFTAPDANRINILDGSNPTNAALPVTIFLTNTGPRFVGALDIGDPGGSPNTPLDDLVISTIYNAVGPIQQTVLRNLFPATAVLSESLISQTQERANQVVVKIGQQPLLAYMARAVGIASDRLYVASCATGWPVSLFNASIVVGKTKADYVCAHFKASNLLAQVLLYGRTGHVLNCYQIQEPVPNSFSLLATTNMNFAEPIDMVMAAPGPSDTRLVILFNSGAVARVYGWDGGSVFSLVREFIPASGQHFTACGLSQNGGLMLYSAPVGNGMSASFAQWNRSGSDYTLAAGGALPQMNPFRAGGNVLQFRYEPLVVGQPILLQVNNAGDWTRQAAFSGSPSNINVWTETFRNPTNGLGNLAQINLGNAHPSAQVALVNQYSSNISLFSFQSPMGLKASDVTISPPPGEYKAAIEVRFSAADTNDTVFYRRGASGAWLQYISPVQIFTNTTLAFYGKTGSGNARSAISYASYIFKSASGQIDSDNDGVPDFVESAKGLDPKTGRDTDGDGFSDLDELLHGTNPSATNSFPSTNNWAADRLRIDDKAAFDLVLTNRPWDGFANNPTHSLTGATIYAYDLHGALLGSGFTSNLWPATRLNGLTPNPQARLYVRATEPHFSVQTANSDKKIGRELLGLGAVPRVSGFVAPDTYAGGNLLTEANTWITSASNLWQQTKRAVMTNDLQVRHTLDALLVEKKIAQLLGARGHTWWTNITLFPHRPADQARVNPPEQALLDLERTSNPGTPAYNLQTILLSVSNQTQAASSPQITNLVSVTREIYRVSSVYNNTNPAALALPADELRYFLWAGTLHPAYLSRISNASVLPQAFAGANAILDAIPARPYAMVLLTVQTNTFSGDCRVLKQSGGSVDYVLVNESGLPFTFPQSFDLVPGSALIVAGYLDAVSETSCSGTVMEVASVSMSGLPAVKSDDLDGNLLPDSWEQFFFGRIGVDPFADADGDGASNMQEFFDGTDANNGVSSLPPVANLGPPTLHIQLEGSQLKLFFQWPASFIGKVQVNIKSTAQLGTPFVDEAPVIPTNLGDDWFSVPLSNTTSNRFYLISLELK